MSTRTVAIQHWKFIRSEVLDAVQESKEANREHAPNMYGYGWLNTFRWAAFEATLVLVLAYLGLVKPSYSKKETALRMFVRGHRNRFRGVEATPYTKGGYDAWSNWYDLYRNADIRKIRAAAAVMA